ncbi:hypothetical protein JEQ12_002446 [Ovis aries]|uniref:Myosin XVB n=1 Tax=Ovis aries TaxID=9940 RepID=A0A836A618_SHEEP|nr:hypothetical protein JEQ12_002446 [Ovis aries]
MGRSKGKAPQHLEGPGRPPSGEQESGSASADSVPSRGHRKGHRKAHREPSAGRGQEPPSAHRKPTGGENGDCRQAEAGPPPDAEGRGGSGHARGGCQAKESSKPGDGHGGRLEEKGLGRGGRTRQHDCGRRRGKRRGRSAQRGRRETPSLDRDTSGGDGASSCLDSEAHEAQESRSQSGGTPERRLNLEQTDMASGGTQTSAESALEAPGAPRNSDRPSSSDDRGSDKPPSRPQSPEGSSGARPQGETEDSGTDPDSSQEGAGPCRSPGAAPGTTREALEAGEADQGRKAAASSLLESWIPRSSWGSQDPRQGGDARDDGVQPEAEPRGTPPERAEASTARGQRRQIGNVVGKAHEAVGVSDEGSRGDGPLAALVALCRLRARPPPGPAPQAAGPRRGSLKDRLVRVARALGLLRWLRLRLQGRAGGARGPGTSEGTSRGPGPRRRRLALSLAGVAGLWGRPRPPPGGGPSSPQVAESPAHDPSEDEHATPDPKFAVVFPRIHGAGRTSSRQSSEEGFADAPAGEGRGWSCAGASADSAGRRASVEGVAESPRGSLGPNPHEEPPLDETGSSSEAEPESLGAAAPVHWAQGSGPHKGPGLGTEALLPRLTLETRRRPEGSPGPRGSLRDRWEPEDEVEEALERDLELSLVPGPEEPPLPGGADGWSVGEGLEDTEDLARLRPVCDSSVLLCLKKRFHLGRIYTFGGPLLLALNPHRALPLYAPEVLASYRPGKTPNTTPHIFAVVASAYSLSESTGQATCILLGGHSGSGKTEAAKKMVQFLHSLEWEQTRERGCRLDTVLPLLSSFGHAKTVLNANASRFGQVLCLCLQCGVIVGASASHHLLETSRVVFQAQAERSFHVFYELLAGLDPVEREQLSLQGPETYYYLNQGRACSLQDKDDAQDFRGLVSALQALGLCTEELTAVWAVLASILQLGNICFSSLERESQEVAAVSSWAEIHAAARLLRVPPERLEGAVTRRVTALRVNGLEQLYNNLGSERLQLWYNRLLLAQEEATDHTFLQKCHYHHGDHPCYTKPQLPLPIFTVRHYAGTVTYQVHKFLNRNRDHLDPAVVEMLAQSQLQLVSRLFQEAEPDEFGGGPGKPTLAARFQKSLGDLLAQLGRSHVYFIQCLSPNPGKLPGLFDVDHVAEQLRQAGILEAVCTRSANFPIRLPFQAFLDRFRALGTEEQGELSDRERCGIILNQVLAAESPLCHLGATQVLLREPGWQQLEQCRAQQRAQALLTLHRGLRVCISHQRLRLLPRKQAHLGRRRSWHSIGAFETVPSMELGRLEIPAELAAMLKTAEGRQHTRVQSITEAMPPEVPARPSLTLPPDINQFPFSSFISVGFQEPSLPHPGQLLTKPLTQLDGENPQHALDINKVMLWLLGDGSLAPWQEQTMGQYLVRQGQRRPGLRDELFSQLVAQLWRNPDEQQSQRGWALMAVLLSAFPPMHTLQKPLLKFVSDQAPRGMAALCQHKLLGALEQTQLDPGSARAHPPTQLEWTAGWRRGRMALDVSTFSEECYSAEVESWTTGEQFAGWILQSRGLDPPPRGWSVSLHCRDSWRDLAGCDFVLDLIGQTEDPGDPARPHSYPIAPRGLAENIPLAPSIQAPSLPPGPPPGPAPTLPSKGRTGDSRTSGSLDGFLDHLFEPVLSPGLSDLEQGRALTGRMKGGGAMGPMQQGSYPMVYPGMVQMPSYQPAMMPAPMPMMPAMGPVPAMVVPPQPQPVLPSVDARQLAAQQQDFINQQARILAQQMTTQAMTLSLEQQAKQLRQSQALALAPAPAPAPAAALAPATAPAPAPRAASPTSPPPAITHKPKKTPTHQKEPESGLELEAPQEAEDRHPRPRSFQQKRDYFQKLGQQPSKVKTTKPPAKVAIPQAEAVQDEEPEEEEERAGPSPPPPPVLKKLPPSRGAARAAQEAEAEPATELGPGRGHSPAGGKAVVRSSDPEPCRAEPSREIRNIIRMYQSRPGPVPVPVQPARKPPQSFLKKNNPKDEALAKLGINGASSPPQTLSPSPGKAPPPPVAPRPRARPRLMPSSSIKEKQGPLQELFGQNPPTAQKLPPPPAPPLPPPWEPASPPAESRSRSTPNALRPLHLPGLVEPMGDEGVSTQLLVPSGSVCFSYASAPWRLFLRKEVFYPRENFGHPYCLRLLCEQILRDTFAESCIRISQDERRKMKDLLGDLEVGLDSLDMAEDGVKKRIVVAARDNWANYFSRIFPVSGESGSDVQLLAVSHRGLRLLKMTQGPSLHPDQLKTLCSYSFAEVLGVECPAGSTLELSLRSEQLVLHTARAGAIKAMVELFLSELKKDSGYVIALRSYITDDHSLLSFQRGDLIKLLPVATLEPGWQFGSTGGRSGLFPADVVQPAAAPDSFFSTEQRSSQGHKGQLQRREWDRASEFPTHPWSQARSDNSATSLSPSVAYVALPTDSDYTMQEFALRYFRKPQTLPAQTSGDAEKATASLVQYSKAPIQKSLISFSDEDTNRQAVESFQALMQFMGDQSKPRGKNELDLLYGLLKLCQEKEDLRDEVYCQAIKQVTGHPRPKLCARGWRFLSLLTGCVPPSNTLMPYVTKFLQDWGPHQELAQSSQEHLQRTVKYGGRRRLPSPGEMQAFLKGQVVHLVLIHLPGGVDYKTNIRTFTVAAEVLEELCRQMGITDPQEVQEFALFLIKGDSEPPGLGRKHGELARPLWPQEYLNSVLGGPDVSLHSRRLGWGTQLHFDNPTYISTHYSQVLRDYLQGKLGLSPQEDTRLARLAALQQLSRNKEEPPSEQDLLAYLPRKQQWQQQWQMNVATVKSLMGRELRQLQGYSSQEAQISFIKAVSELPLFGYTVYPVLRVSNPALPSPGLLGLNRQHLVLMDPSSQELCCSIALRDLQRLHLLSPLEAEGSPGLELNYGSADNPQTIWFELPQAQELKHTITFLLDGNPPSS